MDPVLITGGTGFIGRRLVAMLNKLNVPMVLVYHRETEFSHNVIPIIVEKFDWEPLKAALSGRRFSTVYHLAAYGVAPNDRDATTMVQVNVGATLALVDIAAKSGARAMVIAGSSAEYAAAPANIPIKENGSLEMSRLYGASKAAAGIAALAMARAQGLPLANARLFNVYGPGERPHRLIPSLLKGFGRKSRVALTLGTQVRDFVYIDDAIDALVRLESLLTIEGLSAAGPYNVATAKPTKVSDFARIVASHAGADPELLGFGDVAMRPDELPWLVGDSDLLQRRTGWLPQHGISEGVTATLAQEAVGEYGRQI